MRIVVDAVERDMSEQEAAAFSARVPASRPRPPLVVSRFQAKAALLAAGKLDQVEAAVAQSGDAVLKLAWAEAVEFRRDSPAVAAIAAGLGLDAAAVDALFAQAAGISA
jgi:hypothetical protein